MMKCIVSNMMGIAEHEFLISGDLSGCSGQQTSHMYCLEWDSPLVRG